MRRALPLACLCLLLVVPAGAGAQQQRSRLAYVHDNRIFSIDAAGSGRTLLVGSAKRGSAYSYDAPEWSPDGASLAFTRSRTGDDDTQSQVQVRTVGVTRSLTPLADGTAAFTPAFSRDGVQVAFVRQQGQGDDITFEIATVPAAGGAVSVVTRQKLGDAIDTLVQPAWTPDGRIAYTLVRYPDGSNLEADVYTVRPDGSDRRRLLLRDAYTPTWSPDGTRMAFASLRDRNGQTCDSDLCEYRGEVYVAAADGTGQRRLTRSPGDDRSPSWAANGSRLLFTSSRNYPEGEGDELYTMTPEGACQTWLTNGTPPSMDGDWQPGTGTSFDAGGCGAVGRRPLIETRQPARRGPPALWLGRGYRGLLLTDVAPDVKGSTFTYQDCGAFQPRDCPPTVELFQVPVCSIEAFVALRERRNARVRRYRGAVLAKARQDGPEIYSGGLDTSVVVDGGRAADEAAVLRGLRPSTSSRAVGRLAAPRVSRRTARILRAAVRSYRSGSRTAKVRKRVRMARALAPLRTTSCR